MDKKPKIIKQKDIPRKVDQTDYQVRMEQSLLVILAHKHPAKAKEIVKQLPVAVL